MVSKMTTQMFSTLTHMYIVLSVGSDVFNPEPRPMSNDPLLQPYQLKHLKLRNRIIVTSHEPAYPEDGMPKERYRAYTVERAKGGVALTMTA